MFTTHPTLLARIKSGDSMSWDQFRDMYRPLIFHCAEQSGLPKAAYLELEQDVLVTFFKASENFEYDPKKGRFRTYLGTLIRNCIAQRQRNARNSIAEPVVPVDPDVEDNFEKCWEKEWKYHLFWLAMKRAKMELPVKVVSAFELCDLKCISPHVAAASLEISLATLYNHRRRVLTKLKKYVDELKKQEESIDEAL